MLATRLEANDPPDSFQGHAGAELMDYITALEQALGKEAQKNFLDMQPGDVMATASDTSRLNDWVGFVPNTPINEGVTKFVEWYLANYYRDDA